MNLEAEKVLTESLAEVQSNGELPAAPKQDFRELATIYYCGNENIIFDVTECLHFSPAPNGGCTWMQRYTNLRPICKKEIF